MSSLASLSQRSLLRFDLLTSLLGKAKPEHVEIMPLETIQAQAGKLRVWCGNLGALQTGYSSLDYRLRETTVMQETVSRLLQQLGNALLESIAVTSGTRLPFEDQPKPSDMSEESTDDDSDLEVGSGPRKELAVRLSSITDCLNGLYRQSYKIRNPALRPTTTKAILYKEVDPETNVDVFDKLHEIDVMHMHELLVLLRQGRESPAGFKDTLGPRLATSITLRRRCFKYWQKHSRKLSRAADIREEVPEPLGLDISNLQLGPTPRNADEGPAVELSPLPAAPGAATILSRTDATPYDATWDDGTEKDTITSFASTALDADGNGIDLPGPPPGAKRGLEFTCPFCHVLCPAKQGRGRAWRQHVLHDLQPYVCTYHDCPQPNELYRTRSQWIKHEDSAHRQCWRCFEHTDHVYISESGLRSHLLADHAGTTTADQIDDLMGVYSSTLVDDRDYCPICLLKQPFPNGMANHLANHLERAALFALPRTQLGAGGSEDGSAGSHGKRGSARSSRDMEGTLSSFKGTVADESESDMEGPGGEAATRMRRRLRGHEGMALSSSAPKDRETSSEDSLAPFWPPWLSESQGLPLASNDDNTDRDNRPPVGPTDASPEATKENTEMLDVPQQVEELCKRMIGKADIAMARMQSLELWFQAELRSSPSRISNAEFSHALHRHLPVWGSVSSLTVDLLDILHGKAYLGNYTMEEMRRTILPIFQWVDCFFEIDHDILGALSFERFKLALRVLSRLGHPRVSFSSARAELAFKVYGNPQMDGISLDGFIRCLTLLGDSGGQYPLGIVQLDFERFAALMLGALGPHMSGSRAAEYINW